MPPRCCCSAPPSRSRVVAGSTGNWRCSWGWRRRAALLLGILLAKLFRIVIPFVTGTLGGNLLEFVTAFGVWIIAERLGLSAVLCLVAFAMTIARYRQSCDPAAHAHSQLRRVGHGRVPAQRARLPADGPSGAHDRRRHDARSAARGGMVRARRHPVPDRRADGMGAALQPARPPLPLAARRVCRRRPLRQGVLVGWCGMRGLRDAGHRLRAARLLSRSAT